MKSNFFNRLCAFLFDMFILSFVCSLITVNYTNSTRSDINDELNNVIKQYDNNEITIEEYNDKVIDINYKLQKSSLVFNTLTVVLYIGYFIIFGYLNNGQTIGKKICKIRVVNTNGDRLSIWNMIVRSLFIYGISTLLFSVIFVNLLNKEIFTYSYMIVSYIEYIFIILSFFMILYRKDGRGLHDIIAKTNVIKEVK